MNRPASVAHRRRSYPSWLGRDAILVVGMPIAISDLLAFYAPTQDIGSAHGMATVISHSYLHSHDCHHRRKVVGDYESGLSKKRE